MSQNEPVDVRPNGPLTTTVPDPEVRPRAKHRHFTAEYKKRILDETATCREPGQLGALLRREGLYSSLRCKWREQQLAAALEGLPPKKRGPKVAPQAQELARSCVLKAVLPDQGAGLRVVFGQECVRRVGIAIAPASQPAWPAASLAAPRGGAAPVNLR